MARYFFHMRNDTSTPDTEGTDLRDIQEAKRRAVMLIGQCLQEGAAEFWGQREWQLDVVDDRDLTVFSILIWGFNAPAGSA